MNKPISSRTARYLTVIVRWLIVNVLVFILAVSVGLYIINNVLQKVYTATALIKVSPDEAAPHSGSAFEVLESPEILLPVIHDLELDKAWTKEVYVADSDQLPDVDALTHMEKILKIDLLHGNTVVKISASSETPKESRRHCERDRRALQGRARRAGGPFRHGPDDSAKPGSDPLPGRDTHHPEPPQQGLSISS